MRGWGGGGEGSEGKGVLCEGVPSRSYAVSAPANQVVSQQYCYVMGGSDIALYRGRGGHNFIRAGARLLTMLMGYWGTGTEPGTRCTESALHCMELEDDDDDDDVGSRAIICQTVQLVDNNSLILWCYHRLQMTAHAACASICHLKVIYIYIYSVYKYLSKYHSLYIIHVC